MTAGHDFAVVGLGHALMDVSAPATDAAIAAAGMSKGTMTLIDETRAVALRAHLATSACSPGGSVSNSIATLCALGATGAFLSRLADDDMGHAYRDDLRRRGISGCTYFAPPPPATGCSIILVGEDGERTMASFLGAAAAMSAADVDEDMIARGQWLLLEGYLFDLPAVSEICDAAIAAARAAGSKIALSLSDPFCVSRHRAAMTARIADGMTLILGNQDEVCALFPGEDPGTACRRLADIVPLCAITRGGDDAIVFDHGREQRYAACPALMIDSTGAGDAFAGGFLYGMTAGHSLAASARIGHEQAALCISRRSARPFADSVA